MGPWNWNPPLAAWHGLPSRKRRSVGGLELARVDEDPEEIAEPLAKGRRFGNPFLGSCHFLRPRRSRERRQVQLFDCPIQRGLRFQQALEAACRGGNLSIEEV